jgi:hypothetical protein
METDFHDVEDFPEIVPNWSEEISINKDSSFFLKEDVGKGEDLFLVSPLKEEGILFLVSWWGRKREKVGRIERWELVMKGLTFFGKDSEGKVSKDGCWRKRWEEEEEKRLTPIFCH